MEMKAETDYFIAEMADVPNGTVIIYYLEVYLENGVKHIENNDGNYFFYRVGVPSEETKEELSQSEAQMIQNKINGSDQEPKTIE